MTSRGAFILSILLAASAAAIQIIPHSGNSALVFIAVLSGFPVYFSARLHWASGIAVYFSASILSAYVNSYGALIFIVVNGITGLSSGILTGHFKNTRLVPAVSVLPATVILFALNYLFGISIFDCSAVKKPISQAIALFLPLYAYCCIFLKLAIYTDKTFHKYINLNL